MPWAAPGTGPCWSCRPARASWAVRRSCAKAGGIEVATACLRLRNAGWRAATWVLRQAASRDSRTKRTTAGRWARRSIVGAGGVAAGAAELEGAAAHSASLARAAAAAVGGGASLAACRRRARA